MSVSYVAVHSRVCVCVCVCVCVWLVIVMEFSILISTRTPPVEAALVYSFTVSNSGPLSGQGQPVTDTASISDTFVWPHSSRV